MKKKLIFISLLVVLASGAGLLIATKPEIFGGDTATLRKLGKSFLEDIQFKDFKKAASYHEEAKRKTVDIPFLIERIFLVKPEQLDIMEYEILFAKVDSTKMRGRVKAKVKVNNLLRKEIQNRELVLYYYRKEEKGPFYLRLESSLRNLEGDPERKH